MSDETNGHNGSRRALPAGCHSDIRLANTARSQATKPFSALQVPLLAAVIHLLHRNLKEGTEAMQRMEDNAMFKLFKEDQYQKTKQNLAQSFQDTVCDRSVPHVSSFILSVLHQGRFSVTECIICMFYISRFKHSSKISLHAAIWRPLFLVALLISDKVWQDTPVRNSALTKLFPVLSNAELKKLEYEFIVGINWDVNVSPESFRQFCETLLSEKVEPEIHQHVYGHDFVKALQQPEGEGEEDGKHPIALHEDNLWAANCEGTDGGPQRHYTFDAHSQPVIPQLAQSPRACAGMLQGSVVQPRDNMRIDSSRSQAHSPGQRTALRMVGPLATARESGSNRQSHSLGALPGGATGTPSASGRMSAAMRSTPLTPTPQGHGSRRGASPATPDGMRRQLRPSSAEKVATPGAASTGSVPRALLQASTSGSASAGSMHRPVSAGGMSAVPSLLAMSGGYPSMRSTAPANREVNSPKGPAAPSSFARLGAHSPNREASSPKGPPTAANRLATSPNREGAPNGVVGSVLSASTGGPAGASLINSAASAASAGLLGCSPSAGSTAQAKASNGRDPHAMSFKQKQQLFAKPAEKNSPQQQRHTLRGPRADSMPSHGSPGMGLKAKTTPVTAARVVAPGPAGVRAVAGNPKFSNQVQEPPQQQPLAAHARSQSTAGPAGTSPVGYGVPGMAPRAALQAQRSRATVGHSGASATVRPSTQQVGSPAPTATVVSARSPGQMSWNTARGRSSSPAYIGTQQAHPGSMPTAARQSHATGHH